MFNNPSKKSSAATPDDSDDLSDISQLSFELFHVDELAALEKARTEKFKPRIFNNERIKTTNYVLSNRFV